MPFTTALSVVEGIFVWKSRTKKSDCQSDFL